MEEGKRRIDYYDSLNANQTRSMGNNKYKLNTSIMKVVLSYLQMKHFELKKDKAWSSDDWEMNPSCSAPQQENRIDCGVFVCMYIDFIHDGCELDFTQKDIDYGGWRRKMMLSILTVERGDKDEDNEDEDIQIEQKRLMNFGPKATKIISEDKGWKDNAVSTKLCWENKSAGIECDDDCQGGEGCVNKRIQKFEWKKVEKRNTKKGKGCGLFALEDIEEDDFIIEYIGNVVCKDPMNEYGMKFKGMNLWINPSKMETAPAKYMNHSCIPNCFNQMWGVKGMPRLCFFCE
jgi:histone-lysine N-methyltransferase SETD2